MYAGQIDGTGNDLYPEIQVLDGETVLLLFHKDSSKLKNSRMFISWFCNRLTSHSLLMYKSFTNAPN